MEFSTGVSVNDSNKRSPICRVKTVRGEKKEQNEDKTSLEIQSNTPSQMPFCFCEIVKQLVWNSQIKGLVLTVKQIYVVSAWSQRCTVISAGNTHLDAQRNHSRLVDKSVTE